MRMPRIASGGAVPYPLAPPAAPNGERRGGRHTQRFMETLCPPRPGVSRSGGLGGRCFEPLVGRPCALPLIRIKVPVLPNVTSAAYRPTPGLAQRMSPSRVNLRAHGRDRLECSIAPGIAPSIATRRKDLKMESFEHLCKVALEAERFVVTGNVKFFVRRKTRKKGHPEYQEHGYEIDLVGARGDRLVLAEVKSYFGSRGVSRQGFRGLADETRRTHYERFKLFNEPDLRAEVCELARKQFGYEPDRLELRMYVGNFARGHEQVVRAHLAKLDPPVQVVGLGEIVDALLGLAEKRSYIDDPVVMTVKALAAARLLARRPKSGSEKSSLSMPISAEPVHSDEP
jgi:hypothetical protein